MIGSGLASPVYPEFWLAGSGAIVRGSVSSVRAILSSKGSLEGLLIKDVTAISAIEANQKFIEKGWSAPYDLSTQVRQFSTVTEVSSEFSRVYVNGSNSAVGRFLVRTKEIAGMSPQQIQKHLALPQVPTHIVDVIIPINTKIQVGKVAAQPSFGVTNSGGVQYQLIDKIPSANYINPRPL